MIGIIGDIILDKYRHGKFTRPNPEGLGQVFKVSRDEYRLGGAAAVAKIVEGLGHRFELIGVVGDDESGHIIKDIIIPSKIFTEQNRNTPTKERLVCSGRILENRVDKESDDKISESIENYILEALSNSKYDVVLISDYGKGIITEKILQHISRLSSIVIVDPAKETPWKTYPANCIIKANRKEAEEEAGLFYHDIESLFDMIDSHKRIIITNGSGGIYFKNNGEIGHIDGINVPVVDVCGAGDTVLAALGVYMDKNQTIDFKSSCEFANILAAQQVQRIGVDRVRMP